MGSCWDLAPHSLDTVDDEDKSDPDSTARVEMDDKQQSKGGSLDGSSLGSRWDLAPHILGTVDDEEPERTTRPLQLSALLAQLG